MRRSDCELLHRLPELHVSAREVPDGHAGDRGLPSLAKRRHAGGDSAGMRHDPPACGMDKVDRAHRGEYGPLARPSGRTRIPA